MSLIFPKFLGLKDFGYLQLFLFYSSFVGFFHFGLNDGIYLRYGGKNFKKIKGELLKAQILILFFLQLLIGIMVFLWQHFYGDQSKNFIVFYVLIFMIINNISSFITSLFQSSNQLKYFSNVSVIISILFIIQIGIYYLIKNLYYETIIYSYVVANLFGLFYALYKTKSLFFKKLNFNQSKKYLKEFKFNIWFGFLLMISSIAGMLILGFGRYIIEKNWGIVEFAKISIAFTIVTFLLFFIRQISLVLFPLLKKTNFERQKKAFQLGTNLLNYVLLTVLFLMPVIEIFIHFWLPEYYETIPYFIYILPICIYEGKMQVLLITYMKALRKEKKLLYFNIFAMMLSVIFCSIGYYIHSIIFIVFSMSVSIIVRGIMVELFLNKHFTITNFKNIFLTLFLVIIFISSFKILGTHLGFLIYLVSYIAFILYNNKDIKNTFSLLYKMRQAS